MTENDRVSRRGYLKYAGAGVIVVAGAAAGAYYATTPGPTPTTTATTTAISTHTWTGTPSEDIKPFLEANIDWRQFEGDEITVGLMYEPSLDDYVKQTKTFEELTGIKVKYDRYDEPEYRDKTYTDLVTQSGLFDVLHLDPHVVPKFRKAGLIQPLNKFISDNKLMDKVWFDYADLDPASQSLGTYDGDIYGINVWAESTMLHYRKDLFEKYGVGEVPETFEDLKNAAKKLNHPPGVYGIAMRGLKPFSGPYIWTSFLKGWGGTYFDKDWYPVFNSPEAVEALEFYADLELNYAPPGIVSYDWYEILVAMQTGKAAMTIEGTWAGPLTGWLKDQVSPEVYGNVYYAPVPKGPAGVRVPAIYTWLLTVHPKSKSQGASWLYLLWFASKEMDRRIQFVWGYPKRTSTYNDPKFGEAFGSMDDWIGATLKSLALAPRDFFPLIPETPELIEHVGSAVSGVLAKEKKAKDALDEAVDAMHGVMKNAGYYG